MKLWDFIEEPLHHPDNPVLPDARVADDEDVKVGVEWARRLQPRPHLHGRGNSEDRGPLAEQNRAIRVIRELDEPVDPRVQLSLPGAGLGHPGYSHGVRPGSIVHHNAPCSNLFHNHMG